MFTLKIQTNLSKRPLKFKHLGGPGFKRALATFKDTGYRLIVEPGPLPENVDMKSFTVTITNSYDIMQYQAIVKLQKRASKVISRMRGQYKAKRQQPQKQQHYGR